MNISPPSTRSHPSAKTLLVAISTTTVLALMASILFAQSPTTLPTGGQVTSGAGSINQSGTQMTVNQATQRMIAQWNSFDIGQNASVQFNQPNATSVALNRIQGQSPSQIFGSLTANGQVVLINPNGIYFGKGATVNVGGLVASSLALADEDFLAGKYNFTGVSGSGSVINAGNLTAHPGGIVALVSFSVLNEGTISADRGSVVLAAGHKVNLDFSGDGMISLKVDKAAVNAQVANKGLIKTPGGVVIMTAKAAGTLARTVVNNSGVIEANTLSAVNGRILLDGGSLGIVENTGTLSAQGLSSGETGGAIILTGEKVGVSGNALVDASGQGGGGSIFLGGGFHGENVSVANAKKTVVADTAVIRADAGSTGTGGQVVVWSDDVTRFSGRISARGGLVSGDGGAVEISSKGLLGLSGRIDAGATNGVAGTLLLDPRDITVASGGSALLPAVDQFGDTVSTDLTIDPNTITAATNVGTAVTLQANNDIFVNSSIVSNNSGALNGGNGGNLVFQAGRSIAISGAIISDNGNITLTANDVGAVSDRAAGLASFSNTGLIDAGTGTVTITMGTNAGGSGTIGTGKVTANNFTLAQNGPTAGGSIDLGETNIANDLTITSNSARNVTDLLATVIVRNIADINTGGGSLDISLPTTDFNILRAQGSNITIFDTNAIQIGTTVATGTFSVTNRGPMLSYNTEIMTVGGAASFAASSGGISNADPYINFNNNNDFQSGVTLSVSGAGFTNTGGYGILKDVNALSITSATTFNSFAASAGGAVTAGTIAAGTSASVTTSTGAINVGTTTGTSSSVTLATSNGSVATTGATTAGSSVSITATSGTVTTAATTAGSSVTVAAAGAVSLGATTAGTDLTVTTSGAISDTGTITVSQLSKFTAGAANNLTLDDANNDFGGLQIVSANNATIIDKTGVVFGHYNVNINDGVSRPSHVYGNLDLTARGDISQARYYDANYAAITVDGTTTFTANNLTVPVNLYLGPNDPFGGGGSSNTFTGGVTLARNNISTGFTNVQLRNTSPAASVLTGLTSVGTLSNVFLLFDSAPAVSLPGMTLTGALKVNAPSVLNTSVTPSNTISQTGPIVVAGSTLMAAGSTGDINLTNASNNFNQFGIANTGARNLTLNDVNAVVFYAPGYHQYVTNDLTITAGGDISDLGNNFTVPGTATFNAGTSDVLLGVNSNPFVNIVVIPAARNVTFNPYYGMTLGNVNATGTVTMGSRSNNGALGQSASTSVHAGSTTTFNNFVSGINLPETGNVLGALAINNGATITIRENDAITQASAWTTTGTNSGTASNRFAVNLTTSNDQAITLDQANYFGDLTLTQVNSGATAPFGAVYVRETADTYYGMTQGSAWTIHGTTKLDSGATSITLALANNIFGPLQVLGATGTTNSLPSVVTLYAKGVGSGDAITDVGGAGAWATGTGAVKLVAYNTTGATAGGGSINLSNTGNVLGDLYVKGTSVTITENDSITDGASTAWFAAETGWTTTGNTTLIVANPSSKSITLDNITNVLGPVAISTTGAGGPLTGVTITDNSNLTQAGAWTVGAAPVTVDARAHSIDLSTSGNVLGAITVSTANGSPTSVSVREDDPITQGATWDLLGVPVTLYAENSKAITLTNAANKLGALTLTGGVVNLTENDAITQSGAWTTGATTLNATANAITLSNTGNVLGALTIATTTTALTVTENDDITQAAAWLLPTAAITLNSQTHDVLITQTTNQLGDLTIAGQNASVVEGHAITDGNAWAVPGLTTLTAGIYSIVLDANTRSNFGTLKIVSAASADVSDIDGIILDASSVTGTLSITADGQIVQIGALTANSLRLLGAGYATLANPANNIANLATGFTGGNLTFSNSGDFAVAIVNGTTGINNGANGVTLTSVNGTITGLTNVNSSSTSITLSTGTALTLPQIAIGGPQTYTASTVSGTGITLAGNVTSTAAGVITFNSPVTLNNDWVVQSTNSNINFVSTVVGASNQLTVNAGSARIDFAGAVSGMGATTDAGVALTVSAGGTGTTFHSTIAANNGLSVTGPVVFLDNVTLADGLVGSTFGGQVTLGKSGGMALSGFDNFSFNGGVLLQSGAATIDSNNSTLTFQGVNTVHGGFGLALSSGTQSITGLDHVGSDITSLVVTANTPTIPGAGVTISGPQTYNATSASSITLNGAVTSTASGAILFNSPVVLGTDSTITTVNSAITFASTVNGALNLTLSSGSGLKGFTGKVGALNAVGNGIGPSITLQGVGGTTFSDTVVTRSGILSAGTTGFLGNVTLGDGDTGSVLNGLATLGAITFSGFDGLAFNAGATLSGDATILSNGSTLAFGGAVSGPHSLTLNALSVGAGTVTGLGQIGTDLTHLVVTGQTLALPSSGLAINGAMSFTATGGITLNGAVGSAASPAGGQIDFTGPLTLATGPIVVTTAGAAVNFSTTVTGAQNLTVSTGAGTKNFNGNLSNIGTGTGAAITLQGSGANTFAGTVGGNSGLVVQNAGNVILQNNVTLGDGDTGSNFGTGTLTVGRLSATTTVSGFDGLTFGGPVALTAGPVSFVSNNSAVVFAGAVDGAQNLSVNSGSSSTDFNAAVGGTTPIGTGLGASIALGGTGVTTFNSTLATASGMTAAGSVVFNGNVSFADGNLGSTFTGAVTLGKVGGATFSGFDGLIFNGPVTLQNGATTVTSNGAALSFNSTINGGQALVANSGSGALQFTGSVGGVTPIASLVATGTTIAVGAVSSTGLQSYTGLVTLNGNLTTTNSPVTVLGATTLGADVVISTGAGAGDITFTGGTSTINGAHALTLAAGSGNVLLGGVVGGITPLTTFNMSGNDLTIPVINSTSTQTFAALNNLTLSQSRTSSVPLSFTADSDGDGVGSFILPTSVTLVTSNQTLAISAADLDLQGTSTINTGSGLITLTPTNARNLFLGGVDAAGQMTVTGSELSRISSSGGLDFKTTGIGWIKVDGITAGQSQNISGVLRLFAQGSGDVSLVNTASTFNAFTAQSGSGTINLGTNLTTTNDPIIFVSPVATTATVTVASGGNSIDVQSTLAANNPLTLSTAGGALTLGGNVTGASTLAITLAGGTVTGLNRLQSTLTGFTLSNTASVTLPAIAINGPQVYNGPVSINGDLTGIGLAFNNAAVIGANALTLDSGTGTLSFASTVAAGANSFTLSGDEINFAATVTGTGNVVLQPSTSSLNVAVGGSAATSALDLTATDLAWLPSNLGGLTLGRAAGTGTLALTAATNFGAVPLTLNGGGGISQSGTLTVGALTLRSAAGINLGTTSNVLGAVSVLGTPTSLTLADSTNLTQGAAWILGAAPVTLNAGSNAIVLTQAANTFGSLALTGGAVQVTEAADTDLGASTAASLTVVSTGGISTSGTVVVSGAASFKTLDDTGRSIVIANSSTFGSLSAVSRNAADSVNTGGNISLALGVSTLLKALATTGNITLTSPTAATLSQDGTSTLAATGLELLGAGNFALTLGSNAITTLAGNSGNVVFRADGGFGIGTVNTAGLTSSGNITLSSTGTVTQLQQLVASGLELLGSTGVFTLANTGNDITTLAGNTGSVSFLDDSGFAVGTVNTIGLTTTGITSLSSAGAVTQSQKIAASGLELLGSTGAFTLANTGNAITTLAGNTGSVSFLENSGYAIGTVTTVGLTTTGTTTLSSIGAVTQSQNISAAGLELLGAGGSFTLTRDTNTLPVLAGNSGSANVHTSGALVVGTVTTVGFTALTDLALTAGGAVTQTQDLHIGRDLNVTTTHGAGDVAVNNNGASSTKLGSSVVGGNYTVLAQNGPLSQVAGTNLQVAGNLTVTSPSAILDGSGNLIGGTTSLPSSTLATLRQSGVITLGNEAQPGDFTVVSEAATRGFSGGPIHGTAIALNNAGNSVAGAISVTTVAPGTTAGADGPTGINQLGGTTVSVAGVASFTAEASTAGSSGVTLTNAGNSFGNLRVSGNTVNVTNSAARTTVIGNATATTSFTLTTADLVTQSGAIISPLLTITSPAAVTLNNSGNNIASLALDVNGAIAYTDADNFGVTGLNAHTHTVGLTSVAGAITQTAPLTNVTALSLVSGGALTLTNAGNTIDSLSSVSSGGAVQITDSAGGLSIGGLVQTSAGNITLRTTGDLTLALSSAVTATTGDIALSAEGTGNFINNSGASALTVGGSNRWLVYSKTPDLVGSVHTVKGGLTSAFRLYGKTFATDNPASIASLGNGFIYADSPSGTLTISSTVTGTPSHIYGDTPTATVGYAVSSGFIDSEDTSLNINLAGTALFDVTLANTMNAGPYSIHYLSGLTSSYPLIASATGVTYTVSQAPLTYLATAATHVYGNANPTLGGSLGGFKLGQTASALGGAITWTTPSDTTSHVGSYAINGSGYTSSNYSFQQAAGNATALSITTRPVTLRADDTSRFYGNANPTTDTFAVTSGSFVNGDTLATTLAVTSPAVLTSNVGSYTLTPSAAAFTTGLASDYAVTYANGNLAVTDRPITLTATDLSRGYGAANPTTDTFTIGGSGLANTDALASTLAVSSPAVATSVVGSYALTPSGAVFTSGVAGNYAVTYADGILSITARTLTITANNQSRVYGNANPSTGTFTISGGLIGSDALIGTTAVTSPALLTSHVGTYSLTPGTVTFSTGAAANYTISYADGALMVTARPITLTASDQTRAYGNANPTTGGFTVGGSGLVNGDLLAASFNVTSPALLTSNVGTYNLIPSAATFTTGLASDYTVSYANGNLGVTARPVTITANGLSRIYGNTNPTTDTFIIGGSGLANTDTLVSTVSVTSPATLADHVGSYALSPGAVAFSSGLASNYSVTYADGILLLTARAVTLTAGNQTRGYGAVNPTTGTFVLGGSGLVNGDTLSPTLTVSSPALPTSNLGNYALTPSNPVFTTGLPGDYAMTFVDGNLAVLARAITITASDQGRLYGDANPTIGGFAILGGLANNDALSPTIGVSSTATLTSNVGAYTLAPGSISFTSGAASNYSITYVGGILSIAPAPLTYTAVLNTKVYGDANPSLTGSLSGLKNSDTLASATTGVLSFASNATVTSNVGSYAILGSGITANSGNYTLVQASGNATALSVTPRPLIVSGGNLTRLYGDPNPTTTTATATGLVNGDTVLNASVTLSALQTSSVGTYIAAPSTTAFSSGLASNYTISYINGVLAITPRPLTITAANASRVYGENNPTIGSIVGNNLVNDDTLGVSLLGSSATAVSNVGRYTLTPTQASFTQGSAGNYVISYADGILSITARPVLVTANAQTKVYGTVDPLLSYQIETQSVGRGFLPGENLGGVLVRKTGESVVGGPYAIAQGSLASVNSNYSVSFVSSDFTITPATLTYVATPITSTFSPALVLALNGSVTGFVGSETLGSATTGTALWTTNAGFASPLGGYPVVGSGLRAVGGNYVFVQDPLNATALTINGVSSSAVPRPFIQTLNTFDFGVDGPTSPEVELAGGTTTSADQQLLGESFVAQVGDFGLGGIAGLVALQSLTVDWVSLPSDAGGFYAVVALPGQADATSSGLATFTSEGNVSTLTFDQAGRPALPRGRAEKASLALYLESNGGHFPVGSFTLVDDGSKLTMAPSQDANSSYPDSTEGSESRTLVLQTSTGELVEITVSLTKGGLLVVNSPVAFIEAKGVRNIAMAGVVAAKQKLGVGLSKIRGVSVAAQ